MNKGALTFVRVYTMNIVVKFYGALFLGIILQAAQPTPLYENNFEKSDAGKVPEEFLILDGGFVVNQDQNNKFLELPGAPLETFGFLFGPTEKENVEVSARVYGTGKGRRFPSFAL